VKVISISVHEQGISGSAANAKRSGITSAIKK